MNEEKINRLKQVISLLISKGAISLQSPQKDIALKIGGNHTNISSALKGDKRYLTDNLFRRINSAFDNIFNESWLLTGVGQMLKSHTPYNSGIENNITGTANDVQLHNYSNSPVRYGNSGDNSKDEKIRGLEKQIISLNQVLESKDETITSLKDMIETLKSVIESLK